MPSPLKTCSPRTYPLRTSALVLLAVLTLAAGCAVKPAGTDGNLVDEWVALPAATYSVPQVGHCYTGSQTSYTAADYTGYEDVPCASDHEVEVVAQRTFTGAAASASHPPVAGDATERAAETLCAGAASDYLGGNWETAFVYLRIGLPSTAQWSGGDRTYTCELGPDDAPTDNHLHGSVKGGLTGDRVAARGCAEFTSPDQPASDGFYKNPDGVNNVACGTPHNAEFGGLFDAADGAHPDPGDDNQMEVFSARCEALLAKYVGQTISKFDDRTDLTFYMFWPNQDSWTRGERAVDCYLAVQVAHPITKSLKA